MKSLKAAILVVLLTVLQLPAIVPGYYGARTLSLGYSSSAYNYDINSIYLNPGLLSGYGYFIAGTQNHNESSSYKGFGDSLSGILGEDLAGFDALEAADRESIHNRLSDVFNSKHGYYGFRANSIGAAFKRYGVAITRVKTAVINPERTTVLDGETSLLSADDLAGLNLNYTALTYTQYSVSYSLDFMKQASAGITVHYLSGKSAVFSMGLINDELGEDSVEADYLKAAWDSAEDDFGRFLFDFSLSASLGDILKASIIVKNYKSPSIETDQGEIVIPQRTIVAAYFKPDSKTGVYLDLDLKKTDLYLNGEEVQPVSLGIERSFFNGTFFARAGIRSDLTEKYLFGSKGKLFYGLGVGVYINKVLVDAGIGIGGDGRVSSFAVSGFFIVK